MCVLIQTCFRLVFVSFSFVDTVYASGAYILDTSFHLLRLSHIEAHTVSTVTTGCFQHQQSTASLRPPSFTFFTKCWVLKIQRFTLHSHSACVPGLNLNPILYYFFSVEKYFLFRNYFKSTFTE